MKKLLFILAIALCLFQCEKKTVYDQWISDARYIEFILIDNGNVLYRKSGLLSISYSWGSTKCYIRELDPENKTTMKIHTVVRTKNGTFIENDIEGIK